MNAATERYSISLAEWLAPTIFMLCFAWLCWHLPAFSLDWFPPEKESLFDQLSAQFTRNDWTPWLGGLFGGFADIVDYIALIGLPISAAIGIAGVRPAPMEQGDWNLLDRFSIFLGRVTMIVIVALLFVMINEVFWRYIFNDGTLWANEASLWMGGFIFLFAGLYAMQQRSHIRIFILYDVLPRWAQRACDTISVVLIGIFAFAMVWGGYGEAAKQLARWETLGTAFDPPIPSTLNPTILIIVCLVFLQSLSNLIRDWNKEPETHTDEFDQDEIEAIKKTLDRRDD